MNLNGLTKVLKPIGGFASKNAPTILTYLSVAGLVTTTIFGAQDTLKAMEIIREEESKSPHHIKMPPKQIVKATWKCYIRTLLMGGVTVGCIIGANSINLKRNAALAGLYSLSETALKEYKDKVVEKLGEDKAKEIKDEIIQDKIKDNPYYKNEVLVTGRGEELCYDAQSGRYFKSDMTTIEAALNKMTRRLMTENFISLNEVYSELGLEGIKLGDEQGWHVDWGQIEPNFSSQIAEDGRPCLVMDFEVQPRYCDRSF